MVATVPIVWEALGQSVIAEEHKGDFVRASALLDDADDGAEAELARGVVALLSGVPGLALAHLDAVAGGDHDPVLRGRAGVYRRLAAQLRWNTLPSGAGGGATEISARWDPLAATDPAPGPGPDPPAPAALAEEQLVGALCALRPVRMIVTYAAARLAPPEVDGYLDDALGVVAPLREHPALRGYADLAAADLAHRAGRPERAAGFLRDALAAYEATGDGAGVGACHLARGDWLAAPASSPQARNLTLIASGTVSSALDWTLEEVEGSLAGLDVEGARAAYAAAEAAFAAADAPRGLATVTLHRGHLAAVAGDHDGAETAAAQAAVAFRRLGDRWGAWLAAVHEMIAGIGAGRLGAGTATAIATAEQAGTWGGSDGSFSYALGLGLLVSRTGRDWLQRKADPERAVATHRLARTLFAALGATTDEAQSLVDRGQVLQAVGEVDGALAAFKEALALLEADLAARPQVADENRLRAVTLAQQIYSLHLAARDTAGMARAAARLRASAARLPARPEPGSVEELLAAAARRTLEQAAVLDRVYRAEDARAAGDSVAAERGFAASLEAAQILEPPEADFLEAVALGHWRRYDEAADAFRRFLSRSPPDPVTDAAPDLAIGERQLERQRVHEQAGAFFRRLRDYPAAIRHFEALERLGGTEWWRRLDRPWEPLSDFGAACEGAGQLTRALELHEQAIDELESRRARLRRDELRTALAGTVGAAPVHFAAARTALRLSEAAAANGHGEEAEVLAARSFWYAERGRARSLLDLLAASAALAGRAPGQSAAVRAWHQANAELSLRWGLLAAEQSAPNPDPRRLAALRDEVRSAEEEVLRREAEVDRTAPAFAGTVTGRADVWGIDEVRTALDPGVVLLAYQHLGEDLLAWAVTADGLVKAHRATVDADALTRQIHRFTDACTRSGPGWQLRGEELVPTLIAPFAPVLEHCERLVIVPSGAAHAMPFHALPWGGTVLGSVHPVSYLPSASSLQFLAREAAAAAEGVLAVGNPTDMVWQALPALPAAPAQPLAGSETEARFVAALFDGHRLLVGTEATESAVRAELPNRAVVHLATHGQLSTELPLLSCVLLAEGEALSVYELMGIGVDAELVVLSACESGRGTATTGGDVLGLTRALLAAGARGLVVTLWNADDESTCVLMADFHRRLRGGAPAPVALARAQDHVRRMSAKAEAAEFAAIEEAVRDPGAAADVLAPITDTTGPPGHATDSGPPGRDRHPRYWAPFVFVGR